MPKGMEVQILPGAQSQPPRGFEHEKDMNVKVSLSVLKVVACLVVLTSFLIVSFARVDPDFWWHLKIGESVLRGDGPPRLDTTSHTLPNYPWVDHEWLLEGGFSFLYSRGLWWLLASIFAVLGAIPFLMWIGRVRSLFSMLLILIPTFLTLDFIGVRPQILSLFLFFILLEILRYLFRDGEPRARAFLFILPVFFFVWANLHGGFAAGLGLWFIFIITAFYERRRKGHKIFDSRIELHLLSLAASVALTFFNAYGPRLYAEVLGAASSSLLARYIVEWFPALRGTNFFITIAFGFFIFVMARYIRRYPATVLFPAVLFFLLYFRTTRIGPLFFVLALPLLDAFAFHAEREVLDVPRWLRSLGRLMAIIFFGLFLYKATAIGSSLWPEGAVKFLKREAEERRIITLFNAQRWGGYLVYYLPEVKIFIDGHMSGWSSESSASPLEEYIAVFKGGDDEWRRVFKKYGINTVLYEKEMGPVPPHQFRDRLPVFLISAGWQKVYEDEISIVLECRGEGCN